MLGVTAESNAQVQQWTVDSVPIVDIRGTNGSGAVVFGTANGATRLPSGAIAIADASSQTVRFFSPDGQPTRSVGRSGQGPGEFRSIAWMGSCGADSVYVWDGGNQQMSVIAGGSGDVARQFRIPADGSAGARPMTLDCSRQRTFGYLSLPATREPTGVPNIVRGSTPLVLVDANGSVVRQVATVASGELAVRGGGGGFRPLGKATSFTLVGDRVYVGTADSAAIDEYLADGSRRVIRFTASERAATQAHLDGAIEEMTGTIPTAGRERASAMLRQFEMPKTLPPYARLLADTDGTVWIVESFPGDATTSLRAVRPGGNVVAEVRIPRALRVFEVGRDYILGSYSDSNAEPHVAVYRLQRR
jgi:hypothetical protein